MYCLSQTRYRHILLYEHCIGDIDSIYGHTMMVMMMMMMVMLMMMMMIKAVEVSEADRSGRV